MIHPHLESVQDLLLLGRYLIVDAESLYIPHEYIPKFDKKIKFSDVKGIEKKQDPVELLILNLKGGEKQIITSELLLENSIEEVYSVIESKIIKIS
jgi:hypothetical protein